MYSLNPLEREMFVDAFWSEPAVAQYLTTHKPEWGAVFRLSPEQAARNQQEGFYPAGEFPAGEYLMYFGADANPPEGGIYSRDTTGLRITNVTGDPIAREVEKPRYRSDPQYLELLAEQVGKITGAPSEITGALWAGAALFAALALVSIVRK